MDKEEKAPRRFFCKRSYIAFAICLAVGAALSGIIMIIDYFSLGSPDWGKYAYHILMDGFGLSGLLLIFAYLLHLVALAGTFDMLTYAMKLLFLNIFRPRYREEEFPENFHEYKLLHADDERRSVMEILFAGLLYLALGFVFLILYNVHPIA